MTTEYHTKHGYTKPKRGFAEGGQAPRNVVFRLTFARELESMIRRLSLPDGASPIENCITCHHFIEATETCNLVNVRPPARVIAFGCDQYDGDIPF